MSVACASIEYCASYRTKRLKPWPLLLAAHFVRSEVLAAADDEDDQNERYQLFHFESPLTSGFVNFCQNEQKNNVQVLCQQALSMRKTFYIKDLRAYRRHGRIRDLGGA